LRTQRGDDYEIRGSLIKQTIKRRHPGFNERAYGFRAFNDILQEAEKRGLVKLDSDKQAGTYIVRPPE
ncbi:MAG: NYN domain-containing protein, partial [Verrucomicrobiota bacterium]|nr:NYN domain-containing protein [Verrucomicrobiota bacterium]